MFISYGFVAILAALIAMQSLRLDSFGGFCSAAFIMADYTGIEYRDIALAALLPAWASPLISTARWMGTPFQDVISTPALK